MSFVFRLERVLRLRRRQTEAASRSAKLAADALARALRREAEADAEIEDLLDLPLLGGPAGSTMAAGLAGLVQRRGYLELLEKRRAERRRESAEAAAQLAEARHRLARRHRDEKVLDQLRERQAAAWRFEEARRERKVLDEVAAIRAARRGQAVLARDPVKPADRDRASGAPDECQPR
ncbi:MAG: flagellar FliJ family protein [Candidatus Krumholzibacteriia bacterium]